MGQDIDRPGRYFVKEIGGVLDTLRRDYDIVRLVDVEECRVLEVAADGAIRCGAECHAIWGRTTRCENCSSFRACHTHCTVDKQEYLGDRREDIHSIPVELLLPSGEVQSGVIECVRFSGVDADGARAAAEREAAADPTRDVLTRLYGPERLYREIRRRLIDKPDEHWLLIVCNIRNFRLINRLFGMEKGNRLLAGLGDLLREELGGGAVYGRHRDDRFLILTPRDSFDAAGFAEKAQARAGQLIESPIFDVRVKLGLLPIGDVNQPVTVMAERAELAADTVRDEREQRFAVFAPEMLEQKLFRQRILTDFASALRAGECQIHLQPQVLADGRFLGAEALVRWQRPDGMLLPGAFLPVLAQSELLSHMDAEVWRQAAALLRSWQGTPLEALSLSVNVDPSDFYYLDVPGTLTELCARYGVPPDKLRVEIMETALVEDIARQTHMVDRLHAAGFLVEIDDFGKGSSSLSLLKDIHADVLKIDMGFLRDYERSERSRIILSSVIRMAERLGMDVVTEGVETRAQVEDLLSFGCRCFQGYFFSRPVPVRDFEAVAMERL